ncbi:MAG TPA: GNAT family N-acetyltransferase [Povalibacter sp.]|nr:GNAT family N-acetyltransferase [Povalibacter sp.]
MSVEFLDWSTAQRDAHDLWSELLVAGNFNPSLHPTWMDATVRAWSLEKSAQIAIVRPDNGTAAVVPFMVRRKTVLGLPLTCLELCSNVFAYHAEIVARGDLDSALAHLLDSTGLPRWDALRICNVVGDGPTAQAMRRLAAGRGGLSMRAGEKSPYVTIDRDWTQYLATRPKKVRANITRSVRVMEAAGESGMRWFEADADYDKLLADMVDIEARSWKLRAGVAIVRDTPQFDYYTRLLPWLGANGMLANVLYVKDRPAAYVLAMAWRGWVGQLKTSFSEELRDAGSRVIHVSLERAFRDRNREYDFLGDIAPHKMRWTENVRAHEDLWAFAPHLRGRALAMIKSAADRLHEWRERRAQSQTAEPAE